MNNVNILITFKKYNFVIIRVNQISLDIKSPEIKYICSLVTIFVVTIKLEKNLVFKLHINQFSKFF